MPRSLVFFASFRGSLSKWAAEGIIDREILHLRAFLKEKIFDDLYVFSYEPRDTLILSDLRRQDAAWHSVHLLVPTGSLFQSPLVGRLLYSVFGPFVHRHPIRAATILKTNQISGSWSAVIAKLIGKRPLLLRFGYILSRRHAMNGKPVAAFVSRLLEMAGFRLADKIVVTSELARAEVVSRSGDPGKVHLVPTYVDTSVFQKKAAYDFNGRAVYVGRFTPQKNLLNLIEACARENFPLDLIGSGEQEEALRARCAACNAPVRFLGRIPNTELASRIQDYTYFVLPSLHEGLPKALIEAMATGLICIGTDIPGTSDLIRDGETGYLAPDPSVESLAATLARARAERNSAVGANARAFIESKFGLATYVRAEGAIIAQSVSRS